MLPSSLPLTAANHERPALIHVHRPQLPTVGSIVPYLSQIDANRWYSNWGPLVYQLEERLAEYFCLESKNIVTIANGTLALTLALMAQNAPAGSLCIMPSWTFTATPLAALSAGLVPYFTDVDGDSWAMTPDIVRDAIAHAPQRVGAIMPVVPFGQPLDGAMWDELARETGIPVVIDAAAAVDSWRPTRSPAMVSLHATKLLGVGEGGLIVSTDDALIKDIRRRANFGFEGSRDSKVISLNAKLSEYHAAIGLASLDQFQETRKQFLAVATEYSGAIKDIPGIQTQHGFGTEWIATTFNIFLPEDKAAVVSAALAERQIETRAWWGDGAHRHTALQHFPRTDMSVTERLSQHTLGLPFSRDLDPGDIKRIASALRDALTPRL